VDAVVDKDVDVMADIVAGMMTILAQNAQAMLIA